MEKITILRWSRGKETLKLAELQEVVRMIASGEAKEGVEEMRYLYGIRMMERRSESGPVLSGYDDRKLARVCFASVMENRKGERIRKGYTGLVLLRVSNLRDIDEAVAVRQGAGLMPHTLLAFVGADGRSVEIVCRGELKGGGLPAEKEETERFHLNLYEKARLAYNAQLGLTVDKIEPHLDLACYVSWDEGVVYNPEANTFYVDATPLEQALKPLKTNEKESDDLVPGHNRYHAMRLIYEYNLEKALDDTTGVEDDEERSLMVLTRLAEYCQETGLDMAFAQRQALNSRQLGKEEDVVRKVFENAYRMEGERRYRSRMGVKKPLKTIPQETLLMMKTDIFLNSNYEFRRNAMRGVTEYRQRTGLGFSFQDITVEVQNKITMQAMAQGIRCWDKDIKRYINSNDIPLYDPMSDFLDHLPKWDGKDRVDELARRIKTSYEDWPHLFHVWMRSMVAMWQGKGQLTGNALVPLLIGKQGCGKSSFCRILLPRDMRDYYNDNIDFKDDKALNIGLTAHALINLDEFDKVTSRQQVVLKYLVSTTELKFRPPYGKAYASFRRYASFIGTTNKPMPLTDPTGSRRFVCVKVEGNIDFETPIDYPQLYAQLKYEVETLGLPYYLSKEEEGELMRYNRQFQSISDEGEMLSALFEHPEGNPEDNPENGVWMTVKEIADRMKAEYGSSYRPGKRELEKIGLHLSNPLDPFYKEHRRNGQVYWVKVIRNPLSSTR